MWRRPSASGGGQTRIAARAAGGRAAMGSAIESGPMTAIVEAGEGSIDGEGGVTGTERQQAQSLSQG